MKDKVFKRLGGISSLLMVSMLGVTAANAAVTLESSTKIADNALHFDGYKDTTSYVRAQTNQERQNDEKYHYHFGGSISAHGDSVKVYKNYVFMSWYRGGKYDRHVMLSRLDTNTGVVKTIEFPHRHTGYQGNWWIGESHNTIGIAVSPQNGTIHMVYDMHAYTQTNLGGKFADDYFRYSYSVAGAAEVADDDFTLDLFVKDTSSISQGPDDYKHLVMTKNLADRDKFSAFTYPKFYETKEGDLIHYMRWGGNNNGAYYYNWYDADAEKWSNFVPFNKKDQKQCAGVDYNWGLYGYMKYVNGKLRVGFQKRSSNNSDKYTYQNGIYYAYLDDPANNVWKDHSGKQITWPLCNADEIKIFEPGDLVETTSTAANSGNTPPGKVYIVGGFDWTVTEKGDIHVIHQVKDLENKVTVNGHLYKPAGAAEFIHAQGISGASNIYTAGDDIYIIGLKNKKPYVQVAKGGTTEFTTVYEDTTTTINFQHGVAYIKDGKVYYYLMQETSGNARPTHLQVIDLGLDADKPVVSFNKTLEPQFEGYEQLSFKVNAVSPEDSGRTIEKVDLYVNDTFIRTDYEVDYVWGHKNKPTELLGLPVGIHTFKAVATDSEGATGIATMQFEVLSTAPVINTPFTTKTVDEGYAQLGITVTSVSPVADRTIESLTLFIDGEYVREHTRPNPTGGYVFGHKFEPHETGAMGWISCNQDPEPIPCHQPNPSPLGVGEHTFTVVAKDSAGQTSSADMTVIVRSLAPTVSFPYAAKTVEEGYKQLTFLVEADSPTPDRFVESVTLFINGVKGRTDSDGKYLFGHGSKPHETGAMGWLDTHSPNPNPLTAGEHIFKAVAVDNTGATSEATMVLTVVAPPKPPIVSFPWETKTVFEGYEKLYININAESANEDGSIQSVTLYVDGEQVRVDTKAKYDFGHGGAPHETGAMGWLETHEPNPSPLGVGEHTFTAVAVDNLGLESTATMTLIVNEVPAPSVSFADSEIALNVGYESLSLSVTAESVVSWVGIDHIELYLDDTLVRDIYNAPYTWGGEEYPDELLGAAAGTHVLKAIAVDTNGKSSEVEMEIIVRPGIISVDSDSSDAPAVNLFDGDYSDDSSWGAEQNGTKDLVIDLGEVKTITSTKLWTTEGEAVKYQIYVADSLDEEFVKVAKYQNKDTSTQPFVTNFVAQGRYVKLMVIGDWPNINEFEVITE